MPFRKLQKEQIICIEQIQKRKNLAQLIFNWCGNNGYERCVKHIRVTLDIKNYVRNLHRIYPFI
jgi:hypothetical protein